MASWVRSRTRRGPARRRPVVVWPALACVFQPLVDLRELFRDGSATVAFEGLSRFPAALRMEPAEVFASARRFGADVALELRAIETQLPVLERLPEEVFLSMNASPETVTSRDLRSILRTVDGRRVVLEVTETAPIDDYVAFNRIVDRLRSDGVRLAVDDLGAGFASLQHLLHLRPELVKLDLEIVQGAADDPARQSLVMVLSSFAADIGAQVVAEGLERPEDLRAVALFGVQLGQGFLLGRPDSLPEFTDE